MFSSWRCVLSSSVFALGPSKKKRMIKKKLAFPAMSLLEIETWRPVGFFLDGSFLEVKEPFHFISLVSLLSQIVFEAGTFSIDSLKSMWQKVVSPFGISLSLWSLVPTADAAFFANRSRDENCVTPCLLRHGPPFSSSLVQCLDFAFSNSACYVQRKELRELVR